MPERNRKDDGENGRMCIVTRESGDPDALIRFVAGPDGSVVPDLKRQLPGRGCWVKAERALVDKAVAVAKDAAQDVAAELKGPAQDAVEEVKESAMSSAQTVKDEAQHTAERVKDTVTAGSTDASSGEADAASTAAPVPGGTSSAAVGEDRPDRLG